MVAIWELAVEIAQPIQPISIQIGLDWLCHSTANSKQNSFKLHKSPFSYARRAKSPNIRSNKQTLSFKNFLQHLTKDYSLYILCDKREQLRHLFLFVSKILGDLVMQDGLRAQTPDETNKQYLLKKICNTLWKMTPYKFCVTNKNTCTIHLFLCQLPFKKIVGDYCSNLHLVMQDGLRAQTPDQTNKHYPFKKKILQHSIKMTHYKFCVTNENTCAIHFFFVSTSPQQIAAATQCYGIDAKISYGPHHFSQ